MWHAFIKIMFSDKFLLLDHIWSQVLVFNLFLARLFSFIIVVFNSFMHACVFATKQALVNLIHVVLGL